MKAQKGQRFRLAEDGRALVPEPFLGAICGTDPFLSLLIVPAVKNQVSDMLVCGKCLFQVEQQILHTFTCLHALTT
jgi:hypothetical protein